MSDGYTAVQEMIAKLRELGDITEDIAADVAVELQKEITGNIAAARDPYGVPWQPTLRGKPPLKNAAKSLTVEAIGKTVIAAVRGIEARHNFGSVRGGVVRRIIPKKDEIPQQIIDLITKVAKKRFQSIIGGS